MAHFLEEVQMFDKLEDLLIRYEEIMENLVLRGLRITRQDSAN